MNFLTIKKLHPNDVSLEYYSWFSQKVVSDNISWKPSHNQLEGIRQLKNYVENCLNAEDIVLLGIFCDDIHIGNLKYGDISVELSACTVGIMIGNPSFRGRGIAAESLALGNKYMNQNHNVTAFELRVFSWNQTAISAYKKAGFNVVNNGLIAPFHPEGTIMRFEY